VDHVPANHHADAPEGRLEAVGSFATVKQECTRVLTVVPLLRRGAEFLRGAQEESGGA
jgi:hypothetical protein